ncbi:MAG: HAD-IIB family hydrolase [Actinobacteria bacterium]|nr:MAG: HAD-IIB family hydrolase [Actinomycetota bacterium]
MRPRPDAPGRGRPPPRAHAPRDRRDPGCRDPRPPRDREDVQGDPALRARGRARRPRRLLPGRPRRGASQRPLAAARADPARVRARGVGDLLAWLEREPTKLVVIDDPEVLDKLEQRLKARLGERLYISKSLPYFLELASPEVTKASGLDFLARRLGFSRARTVACGDGENDVELLEWAGYGVAVANAHERVLAVADLVCPSVDEEGVAQVLEAFLDSSP